MQLNFVKTNPTENMTVFILDQIPRSQYAEVAKKLMNYNSLHAEQVGFVEKATDMSNLACCRLHMMGGEFCGNAIRAFAATLAYKEHCSIEHQNEHMTISLEVSGANNILQCEVKPTSYSKKFYSSVEMPLATGVDNFKLEFNNKLYKGFLVAFPGIIHLVIEGVPNNLKQDFFVAVKGKLEHLDYDAYGIMFYNETDSFIEPLVYVKDTDSLIWERGCGSGTSALGVALSHKLEKSVDIWVNQPGGELQIITKWNGNNVEHIQLNGTVEIVAEGVVYIEHSI